ncbi:hypothetical protein ABEW32_15420 [Paenibacillus jamilae]|uniref:hypothetical protein n=1 Tax=Paenibacillus jamilae TaxID=114136 RepID=UPI003D273BC6
MFIRQRDILTPEEVLSIDKEILDPLCEKTWFDYKPGDQFFIIEQPETPYVIESTMLDEDYHYILIYGNGQKIIYSDAYPLFTTGMLIECLSLHHAFILHSFGNGWIVLWDSMISIESEKGELLVSFLWRALIEIEKSGTFFW